jgi:hypothetical protein
VVQVVGEVQFARVMRPLTTRAMRGTLNEKALEISWSLTRGKVGRTSRPDDQEQGEDGE